MEDKEVDPYEQQLVAEFESCDIDKIGSLDRQGLTQLCEQLQLDEEGAETITNLGGDTEERVTFVEFRKGLLALLSKGKDKIETAPDTVENSQQSEREISPKFVLGKKKYGRRTRPKSLDCGSQASKDDSDSEVSATSSVQASVSDQADDGPAPASSQHPKKRRTTLAEDGQQSSSDDGQQGSSTTFNVRSPPTLEDVFPPPMDQRVWHTTVSVEAVAEACEELGMMEGVSLIRELGFTGSLIQLSSLRTVLEEVLLYPTLQDDQPALNDRERMLLSAFAIRRFEVFILEGHLDQFECERDKLRTDILEANERASLVAIEVDETHSKLELSQKLALKVLEQRHAETVKQLTEQLAVERDGLAQQQHVLESRVWELETLELEARAKSSALMEENESLATDSRTLAEQLAKAEGDLKTAHRELSDVDGMRQAAHFALMESDKEVMGLKDSMAHLQMENTGLRDLADELMMKVESMGSQMASMSLKLALQSSGQRPNPEETMEEEICLVTGDVIVPGSAIKRRGAPPEHTTSDSEDSADDESSPRLEKLMRCTVPPQNTSAKGFKIRTPPMLNGSVANHPSGSGGASSSSTSGPSFVVVDTPEHSYLATVNSRLQAEVKVLTKRVRILTQKVNQRNEIILDNPEVCEAENNHRLKEFLEQGDFFPSPQLTDTLNQITEECSSSTKDMNECENTKEQLEQHCRDLKSQLDKVKVEIVKILSERNACSKENCALKNHISDLKSSLGHSSLEETDNYYRVAFLSESPSLGTENIPASGEPSLELKSGISEDCLVMSDTNVINVNEDRTVKNDESESIFLLKCEFADQLSVVEENHMKEKIELLERCTNLESSIEMLRQEYEKCEDYWASKLEEERVIYDKEQRTLDKKYKKILAELKEYDEYLNEDRPCTCRRLATIEESEKLEYQVTAVEEECEDLRKQLASEKAERAHEYQRMIEQLNQQQIRFAAYSGELCHSIGIQFPEQGTAIGGQDMLTNPPRDELQPTGSVDDLRNMLATRDLLSADISTLRRQKELLTQSIQEEKNGKYGGGMGCGKQACCVDLTVLQTLNARWRQQEQQCRHLQHALKQRQRHTDMLMQHTWAQHKKEISDLEVVLDTTQKNLHQQSMTCKEQVDRLVRNDVLVKDLYVENAYLVATVQRLEQRCQGLAQMTTDSISV